MEANQTRSPNKAAIWCGQKPPLKPKDIWAIQIHLHNEHQVRDLAMFNLTIDSKLRGCDLVNLRVRDVDARRSDNAPSYGRAAEDPTTGAIRTDRADEVRGFCIDQKANLKAEQYLFPSRQARSPHISTRQYPRTPTRVAAIRLDTTAYGTHSMRRTKATLIYKRTKNLRAVQLLLGHTKLESTLRYLGIEVDDALEISEHTEI